MDFLFDEIFDLIPKVIGQTPKDIKESTDTAITELIGFGQKGTVTEKFHLDGSGNYYKEKNQDGYGVKVKCSATIDAPKNGIFDVVITSSAGGGGKWDNLKTDDQFNFIIKTEEIDKKTRLTVSVHSPNMSNIDGAVTLHYSY